ncbi:helix-turn-helix transcriptional regulator [Lichenibacterium ramalinae]|uniref:XRE family transcriptional regulator n=1 Tax=Lichenibacterium ramalinae TaxID=2316527 RepID=A0A4V1RIK4_9HYPH|nr:helix-turn-helix transcriptional regulator [Lichenibacterium ramalinae]RYB04321.1 XRE family transcriptional regulator [Lichenibacterium ramalinae]
MTPVQLRAARLMLGWTQDELAKAAKVSRASVNRHESGTGVGEGQTLLMQRALEDDGIVLLPDGAVVEGVPVFGGVGLRRPG